MHSLLRLFCLLACAASTAGAATVIAPNITVQPISQNVTAGSKVSFSVTATGNSLKYAWTFKGGNITGATKSIYTITKVVGANAGVYQCTVYNTAGSVKSNPVTLGVGTNYAGKYNIAVIEYDATAVGNMTQLNGNETSGGALYGSETVTGSGSFYTFTTTLKGYLGEDVTGSTNTTTGNISNGVININTSGNDITFTKVYGADGVTLIGFIGYGTPVGDNTNHAFVLGLNATTTAPSNVTAIVGNYTVVVISYNATAVSKKNAAQDDGDAQIGNATVFSNGNVSINQATYADGGGDQLGVSQLITGKVSSSGVISSVLVDTGHGLVNHPISVKFVTLNGQVIGFTGTFKPIAGESNSGILIGIRGTFTPYLPPLTP